MCPLYRVVTGAWVGCNLAKVISEKCQGTEKKDPTLVLCSKVRPCLRGCTAMAVTAQGLLQLCVCSGKCCLFKVNDSETKERSTIGTHFGSLWHSEKQEEHVNRIHHGTNSYILTLLAWGGNEVMRRLLCCTSSVGRKCPLSLPKMRRSSKTEQTFLPICSSKPTVTSAGRKFCTVGV